MGGIIRGVMVAAGFSNPMTAYDMKEEDKDGYAMFLLRLESS